MGRGQGVAGRGALERADRDSSHPFLLGLLDVAMETRQKKLPPPKRARNPNHGRRLTAGQQLRKHRSWRV
jgi:hypothetical protein